MVQLSSFTPKQVGTLHFVGIGGIGMSGIAEILHNLGYNVKGSDCSKNANVERLRDLGIDVIVGQKAENIENASVVVRSSAIGDENPEIIAARKLHIPVIGRAEMLSEIMRLKTSVAIAGTHGKTTTTSLIGALFEAQSLDPTVINGGIINAYGTNAYLGSGDWLVAEADESDGSFLKLPVTVGVVTNIDPEHLSHYGDFDTLKAAFTAFIERIPFYGFAVMCKDHPVVDELVGKITDRKIITYGLNSDADITATNITHNSNGSSTFDVHIGPRLRIGDQTIDHVTLNMPGIHNVQNSLAAIAIAAELGFDIKNIIKGLADFQGVKRRFTITGTINDVTIVDDYAHHPKEISVTLKTAKTFSNKNGKVIAVVQPHRYSRVQELFSEFCECFSDADKIIVTPIFEAGESPIEGISQETLIDGIHKAHGAEVIALGDRNELAELIADHSQSGDIVVCMGAGSISNWAQELPNELAKKAA